MILITRPQGFAQETAKLLSQKGLKSLISPVMAIHPLACEVTEYPDVAIFTSANGVSFCPKEVVRSTPLALTVGEATAKEAKRRGFQKVVSASGDVHSLEQLIRTSYASQNLSFRYFSAETVSYDLAPSLREQGLNISRSRVYEAQEASGLVSDAEKAFKNKKITSVLFFSARTARIFMKIILRYRTMEDLRKVRAVCISQNVANVLGKNDWLSIDVAEKPTAQAIIEKLL